jgi:hypothetical protein
MDTDSTVAMALLWCSSTVHQKAAIARFCALDA